MEGRRYWYEETAEELDAADAAELYSAEDEGLLEWEANPDRYDSFAAVLLEDAFRSAA